MGDPLVMIDEPTEGRHRSLFSRSALIRHARRGVAILLVEQKL